MPDIKDTAIAFLHLAAGGRAREAFELHAGPRIRHHNAWFRGDAESLIAAMDDAARQNPKTRVDVKHALRDGNLVAVHSHVKHAPEHRGFAVVHLFRFENDKIAELWDVVMEVPESSPNEHGLF